MKQKSTINRIWRYIGNYKIHLILVMIFAILGNILVLLGPLLTGKAIDYMKGLGKVEF